MKKLLILALILVLGGCGNQPYGSLSVEGLEEMKNQGVTMIDIRLPEQWEETGVIPGSHLLTLFDKNQRFSPSTFDKMAEIAGGKDKPIILLSQTGRRSTTALRVMTEQLGFTNVYHAASGISGWQVHRKPMVKPADNQ